jgi:orotidine-5'-phosphate decarboxylase
MPSILYGLVLANDLTVPEQAVKVSEQVAPYVDGIKIGVTTILNPGISLIKVIKKLSQKTVIADFKVADIGFRNKEKKSWEGTNAKIVEKVVDAGADYVICHSIIGISSIQECVEVAHSHGAKVLTLPYMTHKGADLFFGHPLNLEHVSRVFMEYGISLSQSKLEECKTISDALLVLGDYLGVDGFIGPANNVQILKEYRKFTEKEIFGPGIGRQATDNSTPKDQLRVFYSVCGKRSAAIIGSAIYSSSNPSDAAKQFEEWRNQVT